ncbi:MAG: hypothetical protein PUA70_03445 [Oribacterium sp.]|nr:hypothetical protein [Oribacterium sp.]
MLSLKTLKLGALLSAMILGTAFPAMAKTKSAVQAQDPIRLVMDSDYVDGKVNDPASKNTRKAYIVCNNAEFHLESASSDISEADVIVYENTYVDGQDFGVRNRIVKKTLKINDSEQLLPDNIYESCLGDGSLYDFVNHCYDVRVYMDEQDTKYVDYYFGIVDDNIFSEMLKAQQEKQAASKETESAASGGPVVTK